jgi:hypothetical protein
MRLSFLKPLPLAVSIASVLLGAGVPDSHGQAACPVTVLASVTVPAGEFSLEDLLAPGSCAALRRAAARVRMGSAPLPGTMRVLAASEIQNALQTIARSAQPDGGASPASWAAARIPERITVRRAGARASCAEIGAQLPGSPALRTDPDRVFDCGAAGRIPRDAPIEFALPVWDAALASWDVRARCVHPTDCVPFLVRVRQDAPARAVSDETGSPQVGSHQVESHQPAFYSSASYQTAWVSSAESRGASRDPVHGALVRSGQKVTLLWDQNGIRVVVPAVALDAGESGEPVRARIVGAPGLIHTRVMGAGELRVAP